jgi:hypothetical protein
MAGKLAVRQCPVDEDLLGATLSQHVAGQLLALLEAHWDLVAQFRPQQLIAAPGLIVCGLQSIGPEGGGAGLLRQLSGVGGIANLFGVGCG